MKSRILFIAIAGTMLFSSCEEDTKEVNAPSTYEFTKDNVSSVSYGGQQTRLDMHNQLKSAVSSATSNTIELSTLNSMYNHQANDNDFTDGVVFDAATLNASSKNLASKSGASTTYAEDVKVQFNDWFTGAATNSNSTSEASHGLAGYMDRKADGSKKILVDANGLEYTQLVSKSLMGAVELDQIVNGYLTASKLEVENNKNEDGKSYTKMEHHWDEAFGYTALNINAKNYTTLDEVPADELDAVDRFWGEYIYGVNTSTAGNGIKDKIMNAFLKGRAAIVAKVYDVRDEQATIIKKELSKVCAIRAVYYLAKGKPNVKATNVNDKAGAFHALSEGYGFVYGLQFTNDGTNKPYFSKSEVDEMLSIFTSNGGLYSSSIETDIDALASKIATKFGFKVEDAL